MRHIVSCTRACPSLFSDRSRSGSANVPGAGSPHSWEESGPAHREREREHRGTLPFIGFCRAVRGIDKGVVQRNPCDGG